MNFVISICAPAALKELAAIYREAGAAFNVTFHARGTAVQSMLELLGIESGERRVAVCVCDEERTRAIIKEQKRRLYIGVPGHGIVIAVPVKSVGGGKTMEFLNNGKSAKYAPRAAYPYELIGIIANEGRTDDVMNAARKAGAAGGTVLHGKGTGRESEQMFFNLSIASEKELVLIVAKAEQKTEIMQAVLREAGPGTHANAIVFSMPISEVAGFGIFDENE